MVIIKCTCTVATHSDPGPVVLNLEEFHAAVLDGDLDGGCPGIKAVLNKLLECGGRAMYDLCLPRVSILERVAKMKWCSTHLASSNAVDDRFLQSTYGAGARRGWGPGAVGG